jgi:hypothetical protein
MPHLFCYITLSPTKCLRIAVIDIIITVFADPFLIHTAKITRVITASFYYCISASSILHRIVSYCLERNVLTIREEIMTAQKLIRQCRYSLQQSQCNLLYRRMFESIDNHRGNLMLIKQAVSRHYLA